MIDFISTVFTYRRKYNMVIAGIVIVSSDLLSLLLKKFETRLVLLLSGLLMCFIGGNLGQVRRLL